MNNKPLTPEKHTFMLKELLYFKSQARQEVAELKKKNDWRMKELAESNLTQARRMIITRELALKYGEYNFEPPPVSTAYWDFNSWCKHLEANGNIPL